MTVDEGTLDRIWYLEGFEARSQKIVRAAVRSLPFFVGRRSSCDLSLDSKMVSQQHAELFEREGAIWVRDLGSTNGTFVNGQRLSEAHRLHGGDILHFADLEFHLVRNLTEDASWPSVIKTVNIQDGDLPGGGVGRYRELREILEHNVLRALFQPLVRLADGALLGYEALGRGALAGAPTSPGELFDTAEAIGLAGELSVACRNKAIEEAAALPSPGRIFLNTHPAELKDHEALLRSLAPLSASPPPFDIVLEIHESAVTDVASLQGLSRELDKLGIGIAFDDFGTGQTRLIELAEAAPNYLKFDVVFIRDIHLATRERQNIVTTLVAMVADLGIVAIAEGVECLEEAEACASLGFEYGQGYYFGRPAPAAEFTDEGYDTETS